LRYRDQPVGLLAVASPGDGRGHRAALARLEHFAIHGAEAIAGVRLCVERSQRLAVEAERNRISVEMHDAVIQSLFAIVCSLDGCTRLAARGDPAAVPELERVQRLAQKTLEQLRRSIHDLWPGELLERQFVAELQEHVADLADLSGQLALEIDVAGPLTALAPEVRRGLFRVAQEALNNVLQHARAGRATVRLDARDDPVRLTVEDDGRGIPQGRPESAIGILGMRHRLAGLGGELAIGPGADGGTRVTATVPRQRACGPGR
jgi:two-component system sensor histidine kinase UhpB